MDMQTQLKPMIGALIALIRYLYHAYEQWNSVKEYNSLPIHHPIQFYIRVPSLARLIGWH